RAVASAFAHAVVTAARGHSELMKLHLKVRAVQLVAAASLVFVLPVTGGAPARAAVSPPNFAALLSTKPYARLFTQAGNCAENRNANQLTGSALSAKIAQLQTWYVHVHAEGSNNFLLGDDCQGTGTTTLASKLSAAGLWTSNYRNGSATSQANAGDMNF